MTTISRRTCLAGLALATPLGARAQSAHPGGQTVRMVVPFAPGGSTDIVARILADKLAAMWGSPVVVENFGGAGGNIGNDRVAKAPTDGLTLLMASPALATNQYLYRRLAYDPERDLVPVSLVVLVPNVIIARKTLPVRSVGELIAYAKAEHDRLTYAHSGVGTSGHLSAELFKRVTGTGMRAVAYRGGAPAVADVLSGNVDLNFANISSVIEQIRSGTVKCLGISTPKPSSLAPELIPIADSVPGFESSAYFGIAMRAGTVPAILTKVEADVRTALTDPTGRKRLQDTVNEPVGSSAAEFAGLLARERERFGKLIADLGIKLD